MDIILVTVLKLVRVDLYTVKKFQVLLFIVFKWPRVFQ